MTRWSGSRAIGLLTLLFVIGTADAQDKPADPATGEDIVVTARRSGAPMWEVRTGGATLILVGEITNVPKETPWRPERLEQATAKAGQVILGVKAKVSPGDILRILFSGGKLKKLPKGRSTADYLSPDFQRRFLALYPAGDAPTEKSLLLTAFDLLTKRLRFNRDTADDATDVVRRAARAADIKTRPVGTIRGKELLDSLFNALPETSIPCLEAAIVAAENGPAGVRSRGLAWTSYDVPGTMASPVELSLGRCWPWADGRFGGELRGQWSVAVDDALSQPGSTLAVVPLRVLAENEGLLDRLKRRGLDIRGPKWR